MHRLPSLHRFIAPLPIRWRLALVSFGLLAVSLAALGLLISITEENTLLAGQAKVLSNEVHIAQTQLQATKITLTRQQILAFPTMSKDLASIWASAMHFTLGQNVGVSMLSFDGSLLATDTTGSNDSNSPVVRLARSSVQQWLAANSTPSYLLVNDSRGQRNLVIMQPVAGWDKSISQRDARQDLSGYRKALLQLSLPTTTIDQSVATTRLILAIGVLAALAIAAVLTLPLINVALRPLVEMERVSSRVAAGALSLRLVEPPAQDEIGQLARAFNRMVARLEAAFARQKRFVADVSHELRTPLTGLGGSLEMLLLRADDGDEETARRLMSGMYTEVERMQRLDEVREQMQGLAHGQEVCCQVPPDLPALRGDADQLRRVLLNIVENALKFTPPAGRVELVARRECLEFLTLAVRDSGVGILPEALPYVFDRFYRADPSRTRPSAQAGGSGLGLSIAKELVEAHGGTIAISSNVGEGTTVTMRLPAMVSASD